MEIALILAVLVYAAAERLLGRKDVAAFAGKLTETIDKAEQERTKLIDAFAQERAELLTRLQHPDVIVTRPQAGDAEAAKPEADELDVVGIAMSLYEADEDPGDGE